MYNRREEGKSFMISANKSPRVLIVDDDKYTRDSVRALMSKWHIEIDEAESGTVAIEKLKKRKYSLMLLDMRMEDKNGLDVLEEMKRCNISIPTILITAYPYDECVEIAMKDNVVLYLAKPLNLGELKKAVAGFIDISGTKQYN